MTRFYTAYKADANQSAVVAALRAAGARVLDIHTVGKGAPDLVVGFRSKLWLLEVKDGTKVKSARKLPPAELEFHRLWDGYVHVVNSEREALELIGAA